MIWAWSILMFITLMTISVTLIGRLITQTVAFRERSFAKLYFSPVVGLAITMLISVLGGWRYGRFSHAGWVGVVQLAFATGALMLLKNRKRAILASLLTALYFVVAAAPFWLMIVRFGAYNPYNDTFTYLVHGQYLQDHSFRDLAPSSGYSPSVTQVCLYQQAHLRMGASFLLGWMQGCFGVPWSYEIYPAVIGVALGAAALMVAGAIHRWGKQSRMLSFFGGLFVPFTLNGFSHGSLHGFLPQTYGILFAFAGLMVWGMTLARGASAARLGWALPAICAVLLAASVHSYGELTPFVVCACGLSLVTAWWFSSPRSLRLWRDGLLTAALTAGLVNIEFWRLWHAIKTQSGAVVGWPVPWSLIDFALFSIGLKAGSEEGGTLLSGLTPFAYASFGLVVVALLWAALHLRADRRYVRELLPSMFLLFVFLVALLLFRYVAKNPWNIGQGQTWSQFKIANWASLFVIGVVLPLILRAARRSSWSLRGSVVFLVLIELLGLSAHFHKANARTISVCRETGTTRDPFKVYTAFARLVDSVVPRNDLIYLHLGGEHHKSRQMIAYFLSHRRLISDWRDDGYLFARMPEAERNLPVTEAKWIVTSGDASSAARTFPRIGTLSLRRLEDIGGMLTAVDAAYGQESDASGWWYWTREKASFSFTVPSVTPTAPKSVTVRFTYCSPFKDDQLRIHVSSADSDHELPCPTHEGWGDYVSPPLLLKVPNVTITINSARTPKRIGSNDSREVCFLVKNVVVTLE